MEMKEAVHTAKQHIIDLFGTEGIDYVALEEVKLDHDTNNWLITIGFDRQWDREEGPLGPILTRAPTRSYKVVCIDNVNGKILSIIDRVLPGLKG